MMATTKNDDDNDHDGDVDGDGNDDLVIGDPYEDTVAEDAGAVWMLMGPVSGPHHSPWRPGFRPAPRQAYEVSQELERKPERPLATIRQIRLQATRQIQRYQLYSS